MLIEEIADIQNLSAALAHCRRGKRYAQGYQKFLLAMPDALLLIQEELTANAYQWHPYRQFCVCDPKLRKILAAPFRDRIVHQAIYQVLGQTINAAIPLNSYACRQGMGNRNAALALLQCLGKMGERRYVIKLDVSQYFASIYHPVLLNMVTQLFADRSADLLIKSLLASHPPYGAAGRGIPIGNVTSQCFANLYLSPIDRLALGAKDIFYIRYMDDMVICAASKKAARAFTAQVLEEVRTELSLTIPFHKIVPLANDPVPFLGFLLDHKDYRPLSRNLRRERRRLKRLDKIGARPSFVAKVETSFEAWSHLC